MRWFSRFSNRKTADGSFDREIAYHLNTLIEANLDRGLTPEEARRQAILDFGGQEQVRQQLRDVHSSAVLEGLRSNSLAALRFLRRSPSFSATVILTLALGIGANTAVFSAIDAIVLRPLPFPRGDELVAMNQRDLKSKTPTKLVAPPRLEDWNRLNSTFQAISGYYTQDVSLLSGALPEKVTEALVAPRFLRLWGIAPALGRDFTSEEQHFGGPNAVIVSDRFWRAHLHSDPSAIGSVLRLGTYSYTVVGVLPASFLFPERQVDIWQASPIDAPYAQNRDSTWYTTIGRLKPGVSLDQARADLATVQSQLGRQFPQSDGSLVVDLQPLKSIVLEGVQSSLWLLYGSVSVLLLIACTNIAALLLARTTEREHEISIRYSLGASRPAIVAQLLSEVFALALAGSLLGLLIAAGASQVFALLSRNLPRIEEITLNWRIAAYSLGTAVAATLVCGLFPALRGAGGSLSGSTAHSSRTQVSARNPWQWLLVGVQVSLAVALLIGSGLLLRSFQALGRVRPGFDPSHVLAMRISAGWGETSDMGELTHRINRTLDGLRSMPGVEAAATSANVPGNSANFPVELKIAEGAEDATTKVMADTRFVSAGYFDVLHIPVLQGAPCQDDLKHGALVVNRSFAERYFPGSSPIGHHLVGSSAGDFMSTAEIRGIVGDAREQGLDSAPQPTAYWCSSAPTPDPNYLVRTHGDPAAMADAIRRKIHELEPGRSVSNLMPLEDHLSGRQAENRLRTLLLTLFAATAMALVSLGIYGTVSYLGRLRRREVGLRLALGASPGRIVLRFLLQGMRVAMLGVFAGLILAVGMSHLLKGMLYGVTNLDAVTYAAVVALILFVSALASLFPAMRASCVDPTTILREE